MSIAAPDAPRHIGRYRVVSRLGEGATSEVFLALDEFQGRQVAVKRLRPGVVEGAADDGDRFAGAFFAAEATLVGRLQHPNVVQILDAVAEGPAPYLVMEYVPGVTLRRHCRPDALLPLEQITEIGFKCAMALSYCWRQGLIHRDVKPANLLARMAGDRVVDVKITDFGSVLNLGADRTQIFRVGSLAYMSPEQLDGGDLDARADMYSLSAVMYHLIAGRPPFDAQQHPALMRQIHLGDPPALTGLRQGVTPALDALVRRGMACRREDRYATWDEFAAGLAGLVAHGEVPRQGRGGEVLDSERFNLLRSLPFFAGFGEVELWEVVHRAQWERHAPGHALYRKGERGNSFHILAQGAVAVWREGHHVATLEAGTSVGEMAYLAPDPQRAVHSADVTVTLPATLISFTPDSIARLSLSVRSMFDRAFIGVLVRRLDEVWRQSDRLTAPPAAPSFPSAAAVR